MARRNGNPGMVPYDWNKARGMFRANGAVQRAKQRGRLPKLDGHVLCVDCGNIATGYDHRDYNKPLDVDPVCNSCNLIRGPALPCNPLRSIN